MAQFGQILSEIGDFGRFQVRLLIMVSVPHLLYSFYIFGQVFIVLDEPHHCSVAWVQNKTLNLSAEEQLNLSVPLDAEGQPESCLMFRPPPDTASLEDILSHHFNETQPCETGWDYPEHRAPSLLNEVRLALVCLSVCCSLLLPLPDLCLGCLCCSSPFPFLKLWLSLCLLFSPPLILLSLCSAH